MTALSTDFPVGEAFARAFHAFDAEVSRAVAALQPDLIPDLTPDEREQALRQEIAELTAINKDLTTTLAIQRATIAQLSKTVVTLREREGL